MGIFDDFSKDIKKAYSKKNADIVLDYTKQKEPIGSGSIVIDHTFDGGLAYKGRLVEFLSFESGGKSTMAIQSCVSALKQYPDQAVIFLDSEQALDYAYAKSLGMDAEDERVMIYQPRTMEEMEDILSKAFDPQKGGKSPRLNKMISTVVVDSVAATRPAVMFEQSSDGKGQKSQHASAWGLFSPKLNKWAAEQNFACILLNQLRAKPQMGTMDKFSLSGNTGIANGHSNVDTALTSTGGNALRYYLSARYLFKWSSTLKEQVSDDETGEVTEARVANIFKITSIKNKINPPYKTGKMVIRFGEGTDDFSLIVDALKTRGLITSKGSFLTYKTTEGEEIRLLGKSKFYSTLKADYFEDMKKAYSNQGDSDDSIESIDLASGNEEIDIDDDIEVSSMNTI